MYYSSNHSDNITIVRDNNALIQQGQRGQSQLLPRCVVKVWPDGPNRADIGRPEPKINW